jgi:CheY-like chemotaxis protein
MDVERLHILVVDDSDDVADSTVELLILWGYDAAACYSGAAGLARARVRRPAAVVLDLAMPRMDGTAFARELLRVPGCSTVPLIALSGYATPEYALRARQAGIGHYLLKATAPERLKELLERVTRASNSR